MSDEKGSTVITALLEPYKGKLFMVLKFRESREPAPMRVSIEDQSGPDPDKHFYRTVTLVHTGLFRGIECYDEEVHLNGDDLHRWANLYHQFGPHVEEFIAGVSHTVQIIETKDKKDGVLIWNGNLPVVYTESFEYGDLQIDYPPDGPPLWHGHESVAAIVGNEVVTRLWGLESAEGIIDTRSLYQAVLAQLALDPEKILADTGLPYNAQWNQDMPDPEEIFAAWTPCGPRADQYTGESSLMTLERRIKNLPRRFFREDIFEVYGVDKPPNYNKGEFVELTRKLAEEGTMGTDSPS
jgi:hypothetical protein